MCDGTEIGVRSHGWKPIRFLGAAGGATNSLMAAKTSANWLVISQSQPECRCPWSGTVACAGPDFQNMAWTDGEARGEYIKNPTCMGERPANELRRKKQKLAGNTWPVIRLRGLRRDKSVIGDSGSEAVWEPRNVCHHAALFSQSGDCSRRPVGDAHASHRKAPTVPACGFGVSWEVCEAGALSHHE